MPFIRFIVLQCLCAFSMACNIFLLAQTSTNQEYQVKAVFLFNFAQFVEWPSSAFTETNSLVIGVLGEDPFGAHLDETVRGEEVNGHSLVVKRYRKVEEIKACHILYINTTDIRQLKQIFESLKSRKVLTVGETSGFTQQGGIIRFFTENRKMRIRINLEAAKNADLTISSKLLRLAEITAPESNN